MTMPTGPAFEAAKIERNWLVWREFPNPDPDKKPRKVPMLSGQKASPEEAAVLTFDEARDIMAVDLRMRLGYLPREASALVGIDLDNVADAEGLLEEFAHLVTEETWTEWSPSGNGLRMICARTDDWPSVTIEDAALHFGILSNAGRYFSVTLDWVGVGSIEVTAAPRLRGMVLLALNDKIAAQMSKDRASREAQAEAVGSGGWWDALTNAQRAAAAEVMLAALPDAYRIDRDLWRDVTFALRPYPETFEIWDAWSRGGQNYDGRANTALWDGRDRGGITIGSLIHLAQAQGVDLGPWKRVAGMQASGAGMARLAARVAAVAPEIIEEAEEAGEAMAAAMAEAQQEQDAAAENIVVYQPSISAQNARWLVLDQPATLTGTVAQMWTHAGVDNYYGMRGLARRLLLSGDAQRTTRMPVIDPRLPYGYTALGDGLGVVNKCWLRTPTGAADEGCGGVSRFMKVVTQVFPVESERMWFLQWLATKVQRPWERMVGVVNVAQTHGTGRGGLFLIVRSLFGGSPNTANISMDRIAGNTSQWSQWLEALLVTVEEADPQEEAGVARRSIASRRAYAVLKEYVDPGEKSVMVNVKGGPTYETQSFTSFLIATNSEDALPIADSDRRFAILQGNDERAPADFYPLCKALAADEAALDAIWLWLGAMDVSAFRPDVAIKTTSRAIMIEAGKTDLDIALEGLLGSVCYPCVVTAALLEALCERHSEVGRKMAREGALKGAVSRWMRDNTKALLTDEGGAVGALRMRHPAHGQMRVRVPGYAKLKAVQKLDLSQLQGVIDALAKDISMPSIEQMGAVRATKVRGV